MLCRWMVEHTFPWFGRNRLLAKDFENLAETQGQLRMEVWKGWVTGPSSEPLGTPRTRRLRRFGEPGGTTKFDHQEPSAAHARGRLCRPGRTLAPKRDGG